MSTSESIRELVILGSGVSTGVPVINCTLPGRDWDCVVCGDALAKPHGRNRRCNVSALVRLGSRSVLIDCGKTMRESVMRQLPALEVCSIDSVVLTHGHADAMFGLDDVRDFQLRNAPPTPVYLSEDTYAVCKRVFPYLMPCGQERGVERRVASIDWRILSAAFTSFNPLPDCEHELTFTPVELLHGGSYICWGFVIVIGAGEQQSIIAYLSDVHEVPERTMNYLKSLRHIHVLVVDALSLDKPHPSHFTLEQAKQLARELQPDVTRCVGMGCRVGLHDEVNAQLAKLKASEGLDVQLAHDGLRIAL